jgi:hypothetical protein
MKKFTFLIILVIFTSFQLYSQRTRDVLYLKNGSVINGTIVEIAGDQYKIRTSDRSIFVFPAAEVDKYVKEAPGFDGRKKEGVGFALESGFLMGSQNSEYVLPFSFNFVGSITYKTKNIFGVGSGVEFIGQTYAPLFFEYKYLLFDRKTTPFLFLRTGGLMHFANDSEGTDSGYPQYGNLTKYKGGISLGLGTGISWAKEDIETYLSFAYRYATTSNTQEDYLHHFVTYKNYYNRLEIKFGFKF